MGLSTWKNAPDDHILKSDVKIAKNYISGFFDYIENIIENRNAFTMEAFGESINKFLTFNEYKILPDKGRISHKQVVDKAATEYDTFNKNQKIESDFDRELKKLTISKNNG